MHTSHLLSFRHFAARTMVAAILFSVGLVLPPTAAADTDKLNGSWVLDEAQSESYIGATKILRSEERRVGKECA